MKTLIFLFSIVLLISLANNGFANEQNLFFKEDGRNWVYAGKTRVGEKTFIPQGEDPTNWSEAIILHYIPAQDIPLEMYYETFMKILNEKSGNSFHSKIIENTEDTLIFEWWLDPETTGAQHGWIRVTKSSYGLQFFRYTTKKVNEVEIIKPRWEKIMSNYNFEISPQKINYNVDLSTDGRDWEIQDSSEMRKSFFLKGENEQNWSERFTITIFDHADVSPYSFYHNTIKDLEKRAGMKVQSKVIHSNDDTIFFEWWFSDKPDSQHEWYKLNFISPTLASGMKYTTKNIDSIEATRQTWEEIMSNASADINFNYNLTHETENQEKD